MQRVNIRKCILAFCAYSSLASPSHAVGLATGPSLGMAGFHTSFDATYAGKKIAMDNLALQAGWFAKLDLCLLYAKLDALFVFDWHKLPGKFTRDHFKYITLPLTIGIPMFNIFRPHIGLIFRVPWDGLDDTQFKGNRLIESYKEKINGYLFGLGIDLSNLLMDIYWEFARSSVARKSIHTTLVNGDKKYRAKQLTLKIGYNLLG